MDEKEMIEVITDKLSRNRDAAITPSKIDYSGAKTDDKAIKGGDYEADIIYSLVRWVESFIGDGRMELLTDLFDVLEKHRIISEIGDEN